ncbi:MAG: hypothetical protein EON93_12155 [Burkholderiales bacterium]|nr:MAG: hypothetical protein EON93_12155 [Burkholderiales bacterium]
MSVEYIKELASALCGDIASTGENNIAKQLTSWNTQLDGIVGELSGLEARDFAPAARALFVKSRALLANGVADGTQLDYYHRAWTRIGSVLQDLQGTLDQFGNTQTSNRSFPWLVDPGLKAIVERDFAEVVLKLFPSGAWKSTVVMAGSVAEAILFDVLTGSPARETRARTSKAVPITKGAIAPVEDWKLASLVKIASDLALFDSNRLDMFDVSLREFRNFIHPKKEVRQAHSCGEGEAYLAVGALISLCEHFDTHPPP